jgi:hypothetical protein
VLAVAKDPVSRRHVHGDNRRSSRGRASLLLLRNRWSYV